MAVNAPADAATTAARPKAAKSAHRRIPRLLPATVRSTSRRPPRNADDTTSAVAGPGTIVSSTATGKNACASVSSTGR